MKLSASTLAFSGHDFSIACEVIAECGYAFIEPAFIPGYGKFDNDALSLQNAARLNADCAAAGMPCRSVSAHVDMSAPDAVESTRIRLDFAAELNAQYLVTNSGAAGAEHTFAANIEAVAPLAEERGVVICIENPGHGLNTFRVGATMAAWKARFDHPFVDLNYDFGNIFTANDECVDPAADVDAVVGTAAHFHVKDVRSAADGWHMCPVGQGSIDYPSIFQKLAQARPDAALSVEMPLRLWRPGRGGAAFKPVVSVAEIAEGLRASRAFIECHFQPRPNVTTANIGANSDVSHH